MKCSACSIEKARQVVRDALGSYGGKISPLCLPYESRDVGSALHVIRKAIGRAPGREFIAFIIPGLRCKLVLCSGHNVDVRIVRRQVSDVLSGLRHSVPVIVVSIDSCVIESKWVRTRIRIDSRSLEKCGSVCREILL